MILERQRQFLMLVVCFKDFPGDLQSVESKWNEPQFESKKTPDLEHMDFEQYQVNKRTISIFDFPLALKDFAH